MTIEAEAPGAVVLGEQDAAAATAAVKALLRVSQDDEDALIGGLIEAALGLAEAFLGQITIARTMTLTVAGDTHWQRLPAAPVAVIGAVTMLDAEGAQTVLASDRFAIDIDATGDGWVRLCSGAGNMRLAVMLTAGLANDWGSLPAPIRQGVAMLAAHLYSERDTASAPPVAVTALWRPYRRMRFAERVPA